MLSAAVQGFLLGASLIVAIGAQNAFVLRQGLLRRHVGPVVAICAVSDALLIALGVAGMGTLIGASAGLFVALAFAGAAFLAAYGLLAVRRALRPSALAAAGEGETSLLAAASTVLALTWANPHVYLDTVVLLGGISGRFPVDLRAAFAAGAMTASVVWFASLGYGARLLQPVFRKPAAWRVLDSAIAIVMFALSAGLVREGWIRLAAAT